MSADIVSPAPSSPMVHWTFTMYGDAPPVYDSNRMQYLVYQREKCPQTGNLHWQCYMQLLKKQRFTAVKKMFTSQPHIEASRGSPEENRAYCTKTDTRVDGPYEFGIMTPGQGSRTDLYAVAKKVATGTPVSEIALESPDLYVKYHRGFHALATVSVAKAAQEYRFVEVYVLTGPPRCGKTLLPLDIWGPAAVYKLNAPSANALWFDGYERQPVLLIDDFASWIRYHDLLVMLEGHPYRIPIKGGHGWALWTAVIITTNIPLTEWYSSIPNRDALYSRIRYAFDFPEEASAARSVLMSLPIPHVPGYNKNT